MAGLDADKLQTLIRISEAQKAATDATNDLLKRIEGLFTNPNAANWYVVDTSPKTFIPVHTIEYVIVDNTNGTTTAYLYRGAGVVAFPDVVVAVGQRKVARIAKTRSVTVVGDTKTVGVFLSAMPIDEDVASSTPTVNASLIGSLATLPSLGEVDIIATLANPNGTTSVPASGSYISPTTPSLLGQQAATAYANLSTAATNGLAVQSPSGLGFTLQIPTYFTSSVTNSAFLNQTIVPNGNDTVIKISNSGASALTILALGWKVH